MELDGKIAIVTGGAKGIGRAIARELTAAGARVVVNYRSSSAEAEALVAELSGAVAVQADVSTSEGCKALVQVAVELGGPQILVNNAGITRDTLLMRMSDEAWDDVMRTNAGGTFRMVREVMPLMSRARGGAIVNIVSVSALRGNAGQANYAASKAAVVAMTRAVAKEMAKRKVRVNCVAPGFIQTAMTDKLPERVIEYATASIPMKRMGQPDEIAPAVRFLCGPGASYITGQVLVIDGGVSI